VFAEFSLYFQNNYEQLSSLQLRELGQFVMECIDSPDKELADAAATCFLENVAAQRCSQDFRTYLQGEALPFYS
jgi:hypothetical protein